MSDDKRKGQTETEYDPRPVSDEAVRKEHSKETVERWRRDAESSHSGWMETIRNRYGKDD